MTQSRRVFARALVLVCALGSVLPAAARGDELIVVRDPGLSAAERADVRADAGVSLDRRLGVANTEVVSVSAAHAERALATLNADPDVRFAVPDAPVHAAGAGIGPDVYYPLQWGLDNEGLTDWFPGAIADSDIDADEAWLLSEGHGVTVAVADMSIDVEHPDLRDNIAPGAVDILDGGGCRTVAPTGLADHGTHVAGIVAAVRENARGIAGVAPEAKVLPVRALDNCGAGSVAQVIDAFEAAGENDEVDIVTGSFGTDPWLPEQDGAVYRALFEQVFARFSTKLFVVAAGNEGNDNDDRPVYPCNTPAVNLICVGMSDTRDNAECWGNVGEQSVDLFAPGVSIWSTVRGVLQYTQLSGTSMSAPMVAGTAALVLARSPELDPESVKDTLIYSVDPKIGMGGTALNPHGRLNAARALDDRVPIGGGPGKPWVSCDRDHDSVRDEADECPNSPGGGRGDGCPDSDKDGLRDSDDNCPLVPNLSQADFDGDGVGDACDTTWRGDDADRDGKARMDDACPTVWGDLANGCPSPGKGNPKDPDKPGVTPTPTPGPGTGARIISVGVKVTPRTCPSTRECRKSAKVTVKLSRTAKVALKVEHRVKRKGRWVWERVTSRSLTATASGRSLVVRGVRGRSLKRGPYRVTVTAGKVTAARKFTV